VATYAQKGQDLPLSSLLVLDQQRLWFFRLLIRAFMFASSLDVHYYHVWDNAVELVTAAEEALHNPEHSFLLYHIATSLLSFLNIITGHLFFAY